jgi:hypothetical protein
MRFRAAGRVRPGDPPLGRLAERPPMTGLPGPGGPLWVIGPAARPAGDAGPHPAAPARPHSVDLLLCGHHYRTSGAALAAAGAVIMDDRRSGGTIAAEHEPGDPVPSDATPRR